MNTQVHISSQVLRGAECFLSKLSFGSGSLVPEKIQPLDSEERDYFHKQPHIVSDLSTSSPDLLKGCQHIGRLPLVADRRQPRLDDFHHYYKGVKTLCAVANAVDTILIDTVLTKAPLTISLFRFP